MVPPVGSIWYLGRSLFSLEYRVWVLLKLLKILSSTATSSTPAGVCKSSVTASLLASCFAYVPPTRKAWAFVFSDRPGSKAFEMTAHVKLPSKSGWSALAVIPSMHCAHAFLVLLAFEGSHLNIYCNL